MENERHGQKRHQFIKHIKRHNVAGKIKRDQNTICNEVKAEIALFILLMLHILKGKKACCHPHDRNHCDKQPSHSVNLKIDRQGLCQIKQCQAVSLSQNHRKY